MVMSDMFQIVFIHSLLYKNSERVIVWGAKIMHISVLKRMKLRGGGVKGKMNVWVED